MNWNDAAEDLLHQVLGQTPYPVREATETRLRGIAEGIADDEGKQRVGVETVIIAWVRSTTEAQTVLYIGLSAMMVFDYELERCSGRSTPPGAGANPVSGGVDL